MTMAQPLQGLCFLFPTNRDRTAPPASRGPSTHGEQAEPAPPVTYFWFAAVMSPALIAIVTGEQPLTSW